MGGCFGISTKKLTRTMPGELRLLSFRTEDFGYHSARKHKEQTIRRIAAIGNWLAMVEGPLKRGLRQQ